MLGIIFFYISYKTDSNQKNIDMIKQSTAEIRMRTIELEGKIKDAKKYEEVWNKIAENKKTTQTIKIDDINKILKEISEKHNIMDTNIQVILPIELEDGIFKRKTLRTLYATGNLSFQALDDVKAILFTKEFFDKLPGYIVITVFEMGKTLEYSPKDLFEISSGKELGAVKTVINFSWYTYREKEKTQD